MAARVRNWTGTQAGKRMAGMSLGIIMQYRTGDFTSCSCWSFGIISLASVFSIASTGSCLGKSVTQGKGTVMFETISLNLFAYNTE